MNTIQQHMQLSQQQRQKHIDLTTKCYGHVNQKGPKKGQWSDHKRYARQSLLKFHQIEYFKAHKIHTCHLCPNSSTTPNGFVCINPHHLYFGSSSENQFDKPEDVRKEMAIKASKVSAKLPKTKKQKKAIAKTAKKQLKEGRHNTQQRVTCPVCGFEGTGPIMKRWHYDNCKHRI